ncbi:MAG: hypothetical protein HRU19_04675 [Pseudobacteriovorax sp.]|nr:hypothetical protein [Pseudobacteriovorax sp.]
MQFRFCIISLFLAILPAIYQPNLQAKSLEALDIKQSPDKPTWTAFMQSSDQERQDLWSYHANQGKSLENWSWEWRIAWLKVCIRTPSPYCSRIFYQGAVDQAAVVRGETASLLGKRFADSQNKDVVDLLIYSYDLPNRYRHPNPLFVEKRILFALKQIGGERALRLAAKRAKSKEKTWSYWKKLNRF